MTEELKKHYRPAIDMNDVLSAWESCRHNLVFEDAYVMRLAKWDETTVWIINKEGKLSLVAPTDLLIEILVPEECKNG